MFLMLKWKLEPFWFEVNTIVLVSSWFIFLSIELEMNKPRLAPTEFLDTRFASPN